MSRFEMASFIKENKYQVFLVTSACNLPASFAAHTWFVLNEDGVVSRWENRFRIGPSKHWGHLHKNFLPPFQGLGIFYNINTASWPAKVIGIVEGEADSLASRLIEFIKSSSASYPYLEKASYLGPNSNTYTQWVLDHFPEFKAKLPWNAIGKGFGSESKKSA